MKEIKSVGMIGRGAIGVIYGKIIQNYLPENQFAFICDSNRKKRYENQPLICNGEVLDFKYVDKVEAFKKVDLLILSTKYTAIEDAMTLMKEFVKEDTIIISTLNGVLSEEDLMKHFNPNCIIRCIARKMDGVNLNQCVNYTRVGELVIGSERDENQENLRILKQFFDEMKFPYVLSQDILHDQWSKLMLNCGLNQVCGAYDVPYGEIQKEGYLRELMVQTMKEVQQVASKEGVVLKDEEIDSWLAATDTLGKDKMPSLRQDLVAKRKTEKDIFGGMMIQLAKKHGIKVPCNQKLYDRICEIEKENEKNTD